ncbi:MAG: ParB/RepB/Spo0J family partition protein [Candidatus Omnitrophica bacterium]|nr:ParB/RepB/Spo0J family partition protein [Candidatus Omnitrophota bacterium]MDE2214586.1 ParB/RepB/Spo0J family partition protein [Candidatus Omnitrophota bacterium]
MENKALGKGLSALISKKPSIDKEVSSLEIKSQDIAYIETISILDNRFQPRQKYDNAKQEELKASIKEKGILQPILVRSYKEGYEVVAGERRLKAAKAIGLKQVPVIIKNVTDREALVLALVENIQREELNAIEEAQGFKRLLEEFQFTQEAVAEAVGKDRTTVTNLLRLLRLPEEIQKHVADARLSMGHARALLGIEDASTQRKMAQVIINKGLSVRQVEDLVKNTRPQGKKPTVKIKNRDIEILEEELRKILGTKVFVEDRKGKGKMVIEYYTLDDLDRILGVLRK